MEQHVASWTNNSSAQLETMVLEVLEENMQESKTLIVQVASRANSLDTGEILAALDKEALKILLFVLIPIV